MTTIAYDQTHFSTIDIPIEDVVVTYGTYEGTLTLRCHSDTAPEDYIATIKSDDWRRIIAQVTFADGLGWTLTSPATVSFSYACYLLYA